jgi:hypothetical protein
VYFSPSDLQRQITTASVAALRASGKFVDVEMVEKDDVHIDLGCRVPSASPIKEFMLMSGQEFVVTEKQMDALIATGWSPDRVSVHSDLEIGNTRFAPRRRVRGPQRQRFLSHLYLLAVATDVHSDATSGSQQHTIGCF